MTHKNTPAPRAPNVRGKALILMVTETMERRSFYSSLTSFDKPKVKEGSSKMPTLPLLSLVLFLWVDFSAWPPKLLTEKQLAPLCFVLPVINCASSED